MSVMPIEQLYHNLSSMSIGDKPDQKYSSLAIIVYDILEKLGFNDDQITCVKVTKKEMTDIITSSITSVYPEVNDE